MAIQQPGFRPAVDRPRDQPASNSPTGTAVPNAGGTAVAPHLKQLDQNRDQGQQGGQGQDKGSGGQSKDGTVVVNLGAREAGDARGKQAVRTAQAQLQGRPVPNQAASLARGVNLFYLTSEHQKRFEKNYKPGGKNSSLSGKAIVVTGETPDDWEDQIEGNMREARHQTRTLSSYHVALGYYDEG